MLPATLSTQHPARCLLSLLPLLPLDAVDVRLEIPEEFPPGVVVGGRLVIEEAGAGYEITAPNVDGLAMQVQSRPAATLDINGRLTRIHHVTMRAAAVGSHTIPPVAVAMHGGGRAQSAPVTVTVSPGNPHLTGDGYGEVAFVPDRIVPGQPTSLVYRCYLRVGERSGVGVVPPADAIRLGEPSERKGSAFSVDGEAWTLSTITWPLTMAKPGTYEVRGQQRAQVGDFFRTQRFAFAVKPGTLTVLPLPEAGRPEDFTGLIGPLTVGARLDRERIAAGEGTRLDLVVSGPQAGLAVRPALPPIPGVQAYPREVPDGEGERVFSWDLEPAKAGEYRVPSFSLPYFDPASASYRRAETPALTLRVVQGRSSGLVVAGGTPATPTPPAGEASALANVFIPWQGQAPWQPPRHVAPLVFAAALACGLLAGAALRLAGRTPRRAHRGRALARALAANDLTAASAALAALLPELAGDRRDAALAVQARIDAARFGGGVVGDVAPELRRLEDVA